MADKPAAYEQARARITNILRDRGPEAGDLRVPACPDSLDFDQPKDRLDPDRVARNEGWADAGVAARRERSLEELLERWEASARRLIG